MVLTEMTEGRLKDQAFRDRIEASIPMRRIGQAHERRLLLVFFLAAIAGAHHAAGKIAVDIAHNEIEP